MANDRPGLLERLGGALNSSDLSPREGIVGEVELIGAMAYTQINPDAAEHGEIEVALIDPRTELASILVRLKYAGDRTLGDRAALLLAHWVRHQKAFGNWRKIKQPGIDGLLDRFVRQGLAEWLYPVCQECSGRELLGVDKGEIQERRVRCTRCHGRGQVEIMSIKLKGGSGGVRLQRDCLGCGGKGWRTHRRVSQTKTRECNVCRGSGRQPPNDAERALVLGLDENVYKRHWLKRFDWLGAGLDRIDRLEQYCLQSQMRVV